MDPIGLLNLVVLIVVVYVALRVGAVLMKVLLGLVAIALLIWLLAGLFGGGSIGTTAGTPTELRIVVAPCVPPVGADPAPLSA